MCGGGQEVSGFGQTFAAAAHRMPRRLRGPVRTGAALMTFATCAAAAAQSGTPQAPAAAAAPTALAPVRAFQAARFAGMHMAATLFYRGIKPAAANGSDVREQQHEAEGLAYWAGAIPGLFPAGTLGGNSRARPEIEANRADFVQKARDLRLAATRLAEVSAAGDRTGFAAQAALVEAACNACHSAYRAPPAPNGQ